MHCQPSGRRLVPPLYRLPARCLADACRHHDPCHGEACFARWPCQRHQACRPSSRQQQACHQLAWAAAVPARCAEGREQAQQPSQAVQGQQAAGHEAHQTWRPWQLCVWRHPWQPWRQQPPAQLPQLGTELPGRQSASHLPPRSGCSSATCAGPCASPPPPARTCRQDRGCACSKKPDKKMRAVLCSQQGGSC